MRLARAMKVYTLMEQPVHDTTGGMQALDRFQDLMGLAPVYRYKVHMSSFGAMTPKPSYLYTFHSCFQDHPYICGCLKSNRLGSTDIESPDLITGLCILSPYYQRDPYIPMSP